MDEADEELNVVVLEYWPPDVDECGNPVPVENEVPCSSVHEVFCVNWALDHEGEIPVPEGPSLAVPFKLGYGAEMDDGDVVNDGK